MAPERVAPPQRASARAALRGHHGDLARSGGSGADSPDPSPVHGRGRARSGSSRPVRLAIGARQRACRRRLPAILGRQASLRARPAAKRKSAPRGDARCRARSARRHDRACQRPHPYRPACAAARPRQGRADGDNHERDIVHQDRFERNCQVARVVRPRRHRRADGRRRRDHAGLRADRGRGARRVPTRRRHRRGRRPYLVRLPRTNAGPRREAPHAPARRDRAARLPR